MTRNSLITLGFAGSALLLGGAFVFQYFGYLPCAMCLWQRWPHAAAIVIGLVALRLPGPLLPALGAAAAATTSGIGVFHTGVERGWWPGPSSCTGSGGLDAGNLLSFDGPRLVLCDQATWVGPLSMASWNALLSAGLVLLWIAAARRT